MGFVGGFLPAARAARHEDRRRAARGVSACRAPTLRGAARATRSRARSRAVGDARRARSRALRLRAARPDPRAGARADLILRQRVAGYRAGDLDRAYPALPLAEDFLHVYGVMPRAPRSALHPRGDASRWRVEREHPRLARARAARTSRARRDASARPGAALGRARDDRAAGAASRRRRRACSRRCTTAASCAWRAAPAGIKRLRAGARRPAAPPPAPRRARALLLAAARPVRAAARADAAPARAHGAESSRAADDCARTRVRRASRRPPTSARATVDGVRVAAACADEDPARRRRRPRARCSRRSIPIVWDRRRFAAFWGWDYRFEAYTPPRKRSLGYYALPLLWRDDVVGWANATVDGRHARASTIGFVARRRARRAFRRELDAELERAARVRRRRARRHGARGRHADDATRRCSAIRTAIWGSTWLAITYQLGIVRARGVGRLPVRAGGGAASRSWCLATGARCASRAREHAFLAAFGATLFGLNYVGVYWAERYVSSGLVAVVFSTIVFMSPIGMRIAFGTPLTRAHAGGGDAGRRRRRAAVPARARRGARTAARAALGIAFALGGTVIATAGNLVAVRNHNAGLPTFPTTAWGMAYGAADGGAGRHRHGRAAGRSTRARAYVAVARSTSRCSAASSRSART